MGEVLLTLLIFGFLAERVWSELRWEHEREKWTEERSHLTHLLISKTPSDVRVLEAEKPRAVIHQVEPLDGFEGIAGLGG